LRQVTYLYADPAHPDRPTGHLESPEWTPDDRALLLGLAQHESTLCPGCGHPKHLAWHSHIDGYYEAERWICYACTAANDGTEVPYSVSFLGPRTLQSKLDAFPPFEIGRTTTEPSPTD
jgi:hypothetical protein